MSSGPLDQSGVSSVPRPSADLMPRIRNPVVESWNDDDEDPAPAPGKAGKKGGAFAAPAMVKASANTTLAIATQGKLFVPILAALAVFMAGSGLMDIVLTALPPKPYLTSWRYSTVGTVSSLLLAPSIAVTLITAVLLLAERRVLAKVVLWLFAIVAFTVLVMMPFFLLDALQMRSSLASELQGKVFYIAIAKTSALYGGFVLVLLAGSYALHRAIKQWSEGLNVVSEWDR